MNLIPETDALHLHTAGSDCQERLVRLLPCPFCGSEAEITDESQPDRPKSWFFAWCKNRSECNCWLADGSPEKVAAKWNRRPDHDHVMRWRHRRAALRTKNRRERRLPLTTCLSSYEL